MPQKWCIFRDLNIMLFGNNAALINSNYFLRKKEIDDMCHLKNHFMAL